MKHVVKGVAAKPSRVTKKRKVRDPDAPKAWNEAGQEVDEDGVPIDDAVDADKDDDGGDSDDMEEYDEYEDLEDEEDDKDEEGEEAPIAPEPDKKYDEVTQALIDVADRARKA